MSELRLAFLGGATIYQGRPKFATTVLSLENQSGIKTTL
jgi:hypothetical protein